MPALRLHWSSTTWQSLQRVPALLTLGHGQGFRDYLAHLGFCSGTFAFHHLDFKSAHLHFNYLHRNVLVTSSFDHIVLGPTVLTYSDAAGVLCWVLRF